MLDVSSPYDATALGTEFTKSEPLIIRLYSTLAGWSEPRKLVTEGDDHLYRLLIMGKVADDR